MKRIIVLVLVGLMAWPLWAQEKAKVARKGNKIFIEYGTFGKKKLKLVFKKEIKDNKLKSKFPSWKITYDDEGNINPIATTDKVIIFDKEGNVDKEVNFAPKKIEDSGKVLKYKDIKGKEIGEKLKKFTIERVFNSGENGFAIVRSISIGRKIKEYKVTLYSRKGDLILEKEIPYSIETCSISKDKIVLLCHEIMEDMGDPTETHLLFCNKQGDIIGEYHDIQEGLSKIVPSKNREYVLLTHPSRKNKLINYKGKIILETDKEAWRISNNGDIFSRDGEKIRIFNRAGKLLREFTLRSLEQPIVTDNENYLMVVHKKYVEIKDKNNKKRKKRSYTGGKYYEISSGELLWGFTTENFSGFDKNLIYANTQIKISSDGETICIFHKPTDSEKAHVLIYDKMGQKLLSEKVSGNPMELIDVNYEE